MAKITPKGKKVKGTKKKDKIIWQNKKAWQKTLSVYTGAGNDIINFAKSKYNNIFYGEAGNDKIIGGTGNDKIFGGKGKDTISAGLGNNTIYFNKGDGTDTILNGGGVDTLVFSKETTKTLKAKIKGNNIVLTGKKGKNTVILKNYMNGNHSAQYVTIGKKKVKVETLLPVQNITDTANTVSGTPLRDNITVNNFGTTVNALSGNDTINIYGSNFNVNPGKGDDVINILPDSNSGERYGTVTINKGDGNTTINGLENLNSNHTAPLTIAGDGVLRYLGGVYPYIFYESMLYDLVLKSASSEKLVFTNFLLDKNNEMRLGVYSSFHNTLIPLMNLIRPEAPVIDIVANKTISINQDYSLGSTVDNGKHTVNVNSKFGLLVFDKGTNTVNFNSIGNQPLFSGGTNTVNINASNNYPLFQAGTSNTVNVAADVKTNIQFQNNDNIVTTAENTDATLWFQSEDLSKANKVYSYGKDSIINYGNTEITLSGDYDKYIEIESEIAITDIKGVTDAKSTDISYNSESNTKDIAFSHYIANKDAEGNDFITILAKDENGNILSSKTNVWGKWTGDTFDLEGLGKDKLKIEYYKGGGSYLTIGLNENKLTQYVDMSSSSIDTVNSHKSYNIGAGILGISKDVYIIGTSSQDLYICSSATDLTKKYTISDKGGTDDILSIAQSKDNFRFFFDVGTNGKIIDDDLYIISCNNSNEKLSTFINNNGNLNGDCIKIEDFFETATGTNIFRYGDGRIEHIEDTNSYTSNDEYLLSAIATSAWNWLKGHNSGLTADDANYCTSIRDAMSKGFADAALVNAYSNTDIWNDADNWNSP